MDTILIIAIVAVILTLTMTLTILMFWYERARRAREEEKYDRDKMRAKLEYMRERLERELYKIEDRLMATEERWKDINHLLLSSQSTLPDDLQTLRAPVLTKFLRGFGLTKKDLTIEQDLVFVLTPFHESKRATFDTITEVCRSVGLKCLRGDEEYIMGDILQHIIKLLVRARLVVANIDGRNPNVFYELGIAHAIDKPIIIISRSLPKTPFDVKSKHLIIYRTKAELVSELKSALTKALVKG